MSPLNVRERMPAKLHASVVTPLGATYRWGVDEHNAQNVVSNISFSTTMPGGFEQGACTLSRKTNLSYDDLTEFSTLSFIGLGGSVAWQGRLQASPRTSGDQLATNPSAVGWQAALDDNNSARQIFIDIDLTHWGGQTSARTAATAGIVAGKYSIFSTQVIPDPNSGVPCIEAALQAPWTSAWALSETWYDAKGIPIGALLYAWKLGTAGIGGSWVWSAGLAVDDLGNTGASSGNLTGAGPGKNVVPATVSNQTWALAQLYYQGVSGATDTNQYTLFWTNLSVVGNHGLTIRGTQGFSPGAQGFFSSDIIKYAVSTWAPKLAITKGGVSTIETTSFIIPHLVYLDPTTAGTIVNDALQYEVDKDWWVDEGPTFNMASRTKHGRDWRARVGPSGLQETGPDVTRMCNRVIVPYNDVTGAARTVGPTGSGANTIDDSLKDNDPLNPVNEAGLIRYPSTPLPNIGTATPAAAIQVGQRFLSELKQASTAGQASLVGYVEDTSGTIWPSWMVRAGDRITFVDAHDPVPRRIVKTNYSASSQANQIDLDSPGQDLDATLARLGASVIGVI